MRLEGEKFPSLRRLEAERQREQIIDEIDVPRYWSPTMKETPVEKVPDILRTRLGGLSLENLSPTFESITTVVGRRDKKEILKPRIPEEALITYVKKLNDPTKIELLDDKDKLLLSKVEKSRVDNEYYEDLSLMIAARRVNINYVQLLGYDCAELKKETKILQRKTDAEIVNTWHELQESLQNHENGSPKQSIFRTKRLIRELAQMPVERRTDALWEKGLTEDQKEHVQNSLDIHHDSIRIANLATPYAHDTTVTERVYKTPVFRGFVEELRATYGANEETGWPARMLAVTDFYNEMQKIIIPGFDRLPEPVLDELGETHFKTTVKHVHLRLQDQRFNKLRGLASEIGLGLLMKGIGKPK